MNRETIIIIAAAFCLSIGALNAWVATVKGYDALSAFFIGFLLNIIGVIAYAGLPVAPPKTSQTATENKIEVAPEMPIAAPIATPIEAPIIIVSKDRPLSDIKNTAKKRTQKRR